MVNPTTVNTGLIVPLTGADVDLWGEDDLNPDFVAIDGMLAGVQSISLSSSPVTLTAPAGFTPTPGAGPVQSQNRVLRFTGVLTADVTVTLPIPCSYLVENFTTGAFDVTLRGVTATEVIAIPQGSAVNIYNDGANVRFVGLGDVGKMEHWAGLSAMPSWVAKCTKRPWLLCDDTVYNISDYPYLGGRFLAKYGGNGLTTFANPDMRGRVPLAYDGTGTRITTAGCSINGQTLGAANSNAQSVTLAANQIPTLTGITGSNSITVSSGNAGGTGNVIHAPIPGQPVASTGNNIAWYVTDPVSSKAVVATNPTQTITVAYTNASQQVTNNVQPAQVTGIWVVKT